MVWLGRARLKRHSQIALMQRRTPDKQSPSLVVENAREALVKECVNKDRLKHLRGAVGYKAQGAQLGGCSSLNRIVREELCGSEFELAKETSLWLLNALSRLRQEPSNNYP